MANLGERELRVGVDKEARNEGIVESVFQIAQVTRPLMSVGKVCDGGAEVLFTAKEDIVSKNGREICRFTRTNGGLYLVNMRLKQPKQDFARQG